MHFSNVSVVGLGYIGLPTAAVIASRKVNVIGVDVNPSIVSQVNSGEVHIVEPDLDIVVRATVAEGFLKASTEPEPADAFLIAVPTPFKGNNHEPDLRFIEKAAKAVAKVLKSGDLVILESTSPVGATEKMAAWMAEGRPDLSFPQSEGEDSDVRIAHCPERVLPGQILREIIENDRVIGGMTPACSKAAAELYGLFVQGACIVTDCRTAEMSKLVENSFRDVNIAFANELSVICDKLSIDVWELISVANHHPRVNILQPGPGVGGHCIAVDPWFVVSQSPDDAKLIRSAREINDSKPEWVLSKIENLKAQYLLDNPEQSCEELTIAVLGLSFKPNVDDLRESPAMIIAERVIQTHPGPVMVSEPHIEALPKSLKAATHVDVDDAIKAADILVLLVDHDTFRNVDTKVLENKILLDTRGMWRER